MRGQTFNGRPCAISIYSERLNLSSSWDVDLETWLFWMRDPHVNRYLVKGGLRYNMSDLKEFLNSSLDDSNGLFFFIIDNKTGHHVGNFSVRECDFTTASCSIGLLIGSSQYWGRGYGRESCCAAFDFIFTVMNFKVIQFDVAIENNAAVNMYLSLGCIPNNTPRIIKSHNSSKLEVDVYSIEKQNYIEKYARENHSQKYST